MRKQLEKFLNALEDYGEYFFTFGSIKKDYNYIKSVLDNNGGRWCGVNYYLYFDSDFNLLDVTERSFIFNQGGF